jgi:hypothetical protein
VAEKGVNPTNPLVQVVTLDGVVVRKLDLGGYARGFALDGDGNIIAAINKHVKVFTIEGVLLADKVGGQEVGMPAYAGVAFDSSSDRIAVANRSDGKINLI